MLNNFLGLHVLPKEKEPMAALVSAATRLSDSSVKERSLPKRNWPFLPYRPGVEQKKGGFVPPL